MTNREYVESLDLHSFADWIFEISMHWPGMDEFLDWLLEEHK